MALSSPGVEVTVIDESFYTPAEPGTVPMIFVATAENKSNGSGTGIASGTLKENAGKPYLITSQRELVELFGDPIFYTDSNNNPIHGSELNEYGLQAAYSLLGVSNRVYVVRADVDLGKLTAAADAPTDSPANGTNWLDTITSSYGVFEWNGAAASTTNGQSFQVQEPIIITDAAKTTYNPAMDMYVPKTSVGKVGDYAIVAVNKVLRTWYRASTEWVELGTAEWKDSNPSVVGTSGSNVVAGATMFVTVGGAAPVTVTASTTDLATVINDFNTSLAGTGVRAEAINNNFAIFNDGSSADTITLADSGGLLGQLSLPAGTYNAPSLQVSPHTDIPEFKVSDATPRPTGSVWVKTTTPNLGANWAVKRWNEAANLWDTVSAPLYGDSVEALYQLDRTFGGLGLKSGDVYVEYNVNPAEPTAATFRINSRVSTGDTIITSARILADTIPAGTYEVKLQETNAGSNAMSTEVTLSIVTSAGTGAADDVAGAINSAGLQNVVAEVDIQNRIIIKHVQGGDIKITDTNGLLDNAGFYSAIDSTSSANLYFSIDSTYLVASLWKPLTYIADGDAPTAVTADSALWYNSIVDEVDIMINDGTQWIGYQQYAGFSATDNNGPIVSSTQPTTQSDGTSGLVTGDLWIDTSDLENYPQVKRYNAVSQKWTLLDKSDQTSDNGILFADARYSTSGADEDAASITDLLGSNYVDPDAPDPVLYPKGMLLWNTRRSGFNVKRFVRNYIDVNADNKRMDDESMIAYYPHRWVTESANQDDGSGSFGRIAQRKVVVQKLQSVVNKNDEIRDDESRIFNLIACPGYPELIGEMVTLNYDRNLSAFIVGDTPMRLTPDATSLNEWATNVRLAVEDNDHGAVSFDEYLGFYYPSGFSSDNAGNNIVVPPSHMALRTIALSDQVSYPWFAPAGTRRGGVTNATSSGYINTEGEFVSVALNEGQRDTLYTNKINPITFLSGSGLVVFGQKTRAKNASAMDRINVSRLVIYMRSQLKKLAKPYIFEPNDRITRNEIKAAAESMCLELVGQRALYDYLVVCDESNNTPARIDRNELWLDIAIEPVKAVEFIYIPLRLKNTGEIAGL